MIGISLLCVKLLEPSCVWCRLRVVLERDGACVESFLEEVSMTNDAWTVQILDQVPAPSRRCITKSSF